MAALQLQALFRVHFKQEIINQKHKREKNKKWYQVDHEKDACLQ